MTSVLFQHVGHDGLNSLPQPDHFADLYLDQIVELITKGKEEYDLKPYFYQALSSRDSIAYRHDVFRDLDGTPLLDDVRSFAKRMSGMRAHVLQARSIRYEHESNAWWLEAIGMYCDAVCQLHSDLDRAPLAAPGLLDFRRDVAAYIRGERFSGLLREWKLIQDELSKIRYNILIRDGSFSVLRYDEQVDYGAVIDSVFERFKRGAVNDYRVKFKEVDARMDHVEAQVLIFVARLFPDEFAHLQRFCEENREYADPLVARFDREVQFYVSYLEYINGFRNARLAVCYPAIVEGPEKAIFCRETFDMALAQKLIEKNSEVIVNEFHLQGDERIIVVSGPNQGGKTTFARTFGQLHFLAALGCPVAGSDARLYLFDRLFTHFEREENIENLRGKLEDDLHRLHDIIQASTASTIVILNEIFTSTTLWDAVFLSKHVMEMLIERDVIGVWVSFIDELSNMSPRTVSMVSTVIVDQPAMRTFKLIRRKADGLAYALAIAEKHGVTYQALMNRIPS